MLPEPIKMNLVLLLKEVYLNGLFFCTGARLWFTYPYS